MSRNLKVLFAAILVVGVFTKDKICEHLGFGQARYHEQSAEVKHEKEIITADRGMKSDYFVNDTIYYWDEQLLDWMADKKTPDFQAQLVNHTATHHLLLEPIEIEWKVLMDIQYRLKYFKELDMELFTPIFSNAVETLHEQEVMIEGFVIPFDEEGEFLSLSFNPFASCFFCGKASPASVISMYLEDQGRRYKMDDFKKFSGTLYLNYDDPGEFYYILRDAKEEKE